MNGENFFVNEFVVILNLDYCYKKVKEIFIFIIWKKYVKWYLIWL